MSYMNEKDFDVVVDQTCSSISAVLGSKAQEYAHQGDRLHNFNMAARANDTTVSQAIWGMATKHLVSVMDLVNNRLPNTEENVNEKIGDLINYLVILKAHFYNERQLNPVMGRMVEVDDLRYTSQFSQHPSQEKK